MIAPAEFIPIAEETGSIVPLGRWVLAQACREVKVWQARLPEGRQVRVSVNVSAMQLSSPTSAPTSGARSRSPSSTRAAWSSS